MRQFIKNILLFSIFLSAVYFICLLGIKLTNLNFIIPNINSTQGGYGNNLERYNEIDNYSDIDILFLGSSHAYRGFDPRIFKEYGYNTFNLGSSSQPPFNSYYLLKQYKDKLKPKKVFIEVYWGTLASKKESIETTVDIISNKKLTFEDINMTLTQHNPIAINTLSYSWVSNLISPINLAKQKENGLDTYVNGGFVQRTDTSGIQFKMAKISGSAKITYSDFQMKYLAKIAELCNENDIQLILIRTPVTIETINTVQNFNELNEELNQFCIKHNAKYLDFCTKKAFKNMGLITFEDFYDGHHMTQSGIEKFNNHLLKTLRLIK